MFYSRRSHPVHASPSFCFKIPNLGLQIREIPYTEKPIGDPLHVINSVIFPLALVVFGPYGPIHIVILPEPI